MQTMARQLPKRKNLRIFRENHSSKKKIDQKTNLGAKTEGIKFRRFVV